MPGRCQRSSRSPSYSLNDGDVSSISRRLRATILVNRNLTEDSDEVGGEDQDRLYISVSLKSVTYDQSHIWKLKMRHLKNGLSRWAAATLGCLALGLTITGGLSAQSAWGQLQAPAPSSDFFSPKLGIYYQFPIYEGNTHGVRLTQFPTPGSPAAQLQLEPGDMIVSMDNQPFYTTNNVESHYAETSLIFMNIRTGLPQSAVVYLR
jgi:hypothetical protein